MVAEYGPILTGIVALIAGAWLFFNALAKVRVARFQAPNWPRAPGVVKKSSKTKRNMGSAKSRNQRSNTYMLDFEFEYTVQGKKFVSTSPLFFQLYTSDDIDPFLDRYPVGKKVEVYYDPSRPDRAVLETELIGKSGSHEKFMAAGLVLLSIILFAIRFETIKGWFV